MPRRIIIEIPDKDLLPRKSKKIGLIRFLCILFRKNESLYAEGKEPMIDEQIREICRKRYPKSKTVARLFNPKGNLTIGQFRGLFNRGSLSQHLDYRYYPFISFRYDDFGERVEFKRGNSVLTKEKQDNTILELFRIRKEKGIYVPPEFDT